MHTQARVDHEILRRSPQMPDVAPQEGMDMGLGDESHPVVDASGFEPLGGDRKRCRDCYSGLKPNGSSTLLAWVYCSMPSGPFSRPMPEFLYPPNGAPGSNAYIFTA